MRIELTKEINLYTFNFIGEVEFSDNSSPYIELLKDIKTKKELQKLLEEKNMPDAAIKNIMERLKVLNILVDGDIVNLEDGFPNKEYGKYSINVYENSEKKPFKNKNKEINRVRVESYNIAENINSSNIFFKKLKGKSFNFSDRKKFEIKNIESDNIHPLNTKKENLTIKFQKNKWIYLLDNIEFNMESLAFNELFKGEWDDENSSLMIGYSLIKEDIRFKKKMEYDYSETLKLENYGELEGRFESIPIIPKTEDDAKEWFLDLLKEEIKEKNRYISKDELEQIWYNLLDEKEKFKKFTSIESFDFDMILRCFNKESKYYWFLQSSVDLYPFNNMPIPKDQIIIQNLEHFASKFSNPETLVIFDRYINTRRHFDQLRNILDFLGKPKVKIFTQDFYRLNDTDEEHINQIIIDYNINRITRNKSDIPHPRYWIFDNKDYYKTTESLDGIDKTSFDLYTQEDIKKINSEIFDLLEGSTNE